MSIKMLQEYHEAKQQALNDKNSKNYETLSDEDKKKFDAIEGAFKLLTEAGVPTLLFAKLPIPEESKIEKIDEAFWQYNNIADFVEYVNGGKPTIDSQANLLINHRLFAYSIMRYLCQYYPKLDDPCPNLGAHILKRWSAEGSNYIYHGAQFDELKQLFSGEPKKNDK
jgi:hypothetical protein